MAALWEDFATLFAGHTFIVLTPTFSDTLDPDIIYSNKQNGEKLSKLRHVMSEASR